MPEYLAPGVYVEETSFRARSIEGVSTSTTAFVGPTRRGPVTGTPDLITSYADFERVYGGAARVHGGENHLAHGVRAYFNEGGARLYVARVFTPWEAEPRLDATRGWTDGRARSDEVGGGRFVARFPGAAGNGRVTLRRIYQPASAETMQRAEPGTLLRTGGERVAGPARLSSSRPGPWALEDGATLVLEVGSGAGGPQTATVTFRGKAARVEGKKFAASTDFGAGAGGRTLTVTVNGEEQVVVLTQGSYEPAEIVDALNASLEDARASLKEDGTLVLQTRRRGEGASITAAGGGFGFGAGKSNTVAAADANVHDLGAVTPQELAELLEPHGVAARVAEGQLELATEATGETATLRVGAGTGNAALGLTAAAAEAPPARGTRGGKRGWYRLAGKKWIDAGGVELTAGALADGADFVTLVVETRDADGLTASYEGLALGPEHPQYLGNVLAENPSRRSDWLEQAYAFVGGTADALALHTAFFAARETPEVDLTGGNDGEGPTGAAYHAALDRLLPLEDISILAAPGHTAYEEGWDAIQRVLIAHVERPRAYQVLVLDTRHGQGIAGAREVRAGIDSKYAALYFPWITVANPAWRPGRADLRREIDIPPSGAIAGIYARNDVQRGVHKAPANEVVRGALRFEEDINFDEQGVLNPVGVNCLRFFPGRGYRVWGARTVSSDPEWKYVSVRRYFNYVERSIDVGTQWAVFEPNGEALWANIRSTVSSFLYSEWRSGALLGTDPKEAYFVRCDRSTMTQNDLDNGRLVCLVGLAVVKPAEFVIFRIGQKTADARE